MERARLTKMHWTAVCAHHKFPAMYASADAHDLHSPKLRFGGRSPLRLTVYGFFYWVVILGALEPGNLVNMAAAGMSPRWDQEALRMIAAGLLGSVTLPAFMYLSRRFPVAHPHLRRNAMVHLASALGLATALVVVSHVLANSLFEASHRLTMGGLRDDLAANELLLLVGLIALSGIAHLIRSPFTSPSSATSRQPPASVGQESGRSAADFREAVPGAALIEAVDIKVRGVTKRVPIEDIDWIEAQGNYLALHIGGSAFLVRETLARFQTLLDSARFIRIHRRTIVALDRITGVEPAVNGDKVVRLRDNHTLRVSRLYRNALDGRLGATIIASTEGHLIQQSET